MIEGQEFHMDDLFLDGAIDIQAYQEAGFKNKVGRPPLRRFKSIGIRILAFFGTADRGKLAF